MHVAVTGSTGLIGSSLVPALVEEGHAVTRLVRREPRADDEVQWDPASGRLDPAALKGVDGVIHLAGHPVGNRRWTDEEKRRVRDSRVLGTRTVAEAIAELDGGPQTLVCASGLHYYGHIREDEVDETSEPGDPRTGFFAQVVQDWEAAAGPARAAGARVVHVRTGILQDPAGGALERMLPFFKLGVGGRLGSGDQWWSWVSRDDLLGIYRHALTSDAVSGPINAVAPNPVTNAEFTKVLGRVLRRPTLVPVPPFVPKLLVGSQAAEEMAFSSIRARPAVAEQTGYAFRHPELESALRSVLDRPRRS